MRHRNVCHSYTWIPGEVCAYCGGSYDARDHVLPVAYAQGQNLSDAERALLVMVPACGSCNGILGARVFDTWRERCLYVAEHLAKKHRRLLESPVWTKEELAALGPTLRGRVADTQRRREAVVGRIAWAHESAEDPPWVVSDPRIA